MKHLGSSLAGVLLIGAMALPAMAAHDGNPSEKVGRYTYDLEEVANNNGDAPISGTVRLTSLPNGKVQVRIEAAGLAPNLPHAQHLHVAEGETDEGDRTFVRGACPTIAADTDGDGLVDTLEGVPSYGGVVQSLTTSGETGPGDALAVERFPVADENGVLEYERTFTPTDPLVHEQLGDVEVVIHGIDLGGNGAYDDQGDGPSSLDASLPLEATIPALCGGPPLPTS